MSGRLFNLGGKYNMKKNYLYWLILLLFLLSLNLSIANEKNASYVGIFYYVNIFGNVHQNPSKYSTVLTTITCGHPVKVYRQTIDKKTGHTSYGQEWKMVKVGPYWGFIQDSFINPKRPVCFQDKFPKFFDSFEMDLADLFYWGKLYDNYIKGKSRVR